MDSSLMQKIMLAFKVLARWEVLVTLGGFLMVWLILRSVANPDEKKPKPIKFQQPKKAAPVMDKEADAENDEEDDSPRSRRAAPPEDDEDDEELIR